MKKRELSQKEVAALAGVAPSVVSGWLAGVIPYDMSCVLKLCKHLKTDFQHMLTSEHSVSSLKEIEISELFEIADEPEMSGIYKIEMRRLKRKKVD